MVVNINYRVFLVGKEKDEEKDVWVRDGKILVEKMQCHISFYAGA